MTSTASPTQGLAKLTISRQFRVWYDPARFSDRALVSMRTCFEALEWIDDRWSPEPKAKTGGSKVGALPRWSDPRWSVQRLCVHFAASKHRPASEGTALWEYFRRTKVLVPVVTHVDSRGRPLVKPNVSPSWSWPAEAAGGRPMVNLAQRALAAHYVVRAEKVVRTAPVD